VTHAQETCNMHQKAYFVFIHRDGNMRRPRGRRIGLGLGLVTAYGIRHDV